MRQIFTSHRLENVEGVQRLLAEAGIETRITQGRSWKGASRRSFSYSDRKHDPSQQPAVWVIRPDDYKRAREILHEAGLLESSREPSYLPEALRGQDGTPPDPARRIARIRLVLLAAVAAAGGLLVLRMLFS
ncbi:pathogenicity-like protein [Arenimonas fontis]|uniref:Pathogenicity-like protein n=1 Tax=Arenimonas fontis TaxID=2608255 RepID=A0A5B2ZCG9_9GAMM|nr:pathogenicity-like protein [Arenimonas fontis]KAA2285615.1 pathogenicity-like protein [Arenimonas fontis]